MVSLQHCCSLCPVVKTDDVFVSLHVLQISSSPGRLWLPFSSAHRLQVLLCVDIFMCFSFSEAASHGSVVELTTVWCIDISGCRTRRTKGLMCITRSQIVFEEQGQNYILYVMVTACHGSSCHSRPGWQHRLNMFHLEQTCFTWWKKDAGWDFISLLLLVQFSKRDRLCCWFKQWRSFRTDHTWQLSMILSYILYLVLFVQTWLFQCSSDDCGGRSGPFFFFFWTALSSNIQGHQ